jgi:hypothetical protein
LFRQPTRTAITSARNADRLARTSRCGAIARRTRRTSIRGSFRGPSVFQTETR